MDFIRFIKSLEELLYEVATWLLFYPRTLWLAFRHPFRLAQYSERELAHDSDDRYADVVSPPMFLLLTLLLVHGIEMLAASPMSDFHSPLARKLMDSDVNLLVFRSVGFSIFPLLMANAALKRSGIRVDRETLRQPSQIARWTRRATRSPKPSLRSSRCDSRRVVSLHESIMS